MSQLDDELEAGSVADRTLSTALRVLLKAVPLMLSSGANQNEYPSFREMSLYLDRLRHLDQETKL